MRLGGSANTRWWTTAVLLGGVALGAVPGTLYYIYVQGRIATREECRTQYPYTNRSLGCATYEEASDRLRQLDQALDDTTALYVREGKAKRVTVWVRDLESSQWAAVGETETFAPASLMKVPLMVAYYKYSELDPGLFATKIVYQPQKGLSSSSQDIAVAHDPLVAGQTYTVDELIRHMIVYSDNDAAALLLSHIDQTLFNQVLVDLGLRIPQDSGDIDFVTSKTYANIFRTLYNSSYLSRPLSEKALALLADSSALKFLATPLPASTVVADKFAEREVETSGGQIQTRELHDCGIVYKDQNPYSICVMTEGDSFDELQTVIQGVSKLVYDQMQ